MSTLLLVEVTPDEETSLCAAHGDCWTVGAGDLTSALGDHVDAVVVGTATDAAVQVVQHVHRAQPLCAVVLLTASENADQLRRTVMYAPDMPASLTVLGSADPKLGDVVADARVAGRTRRAHQRTLASVARQRSEEPPVALAPASLGALLDHAPFGVLVGNLEGDLVSWNRWAGDLLAIAHDAAGQRLSSLFAVPEPVEEAFAAARAGRETGPAVIVEGPGESAVEVSTAPTRLENGQEALLFLLADVTARRQAELTRDRLAAHVGLLGRVSEVLAGSLDTTGALQRLAGEVVPGLADWVSLQTYDGRGRLRSVVVHHRDTRRAGTATRFQEALVDGRGPVTPGPRGVGGPAPVLLPAVDPDQVAAFITDPHTRAWAEELGIASVVAVPLPGRQETLGSMALVRTAGSPPYTQQDLAAATEVGRRAGVALETASLYAQQRDLAEELQRSLLTDPPQTEGAEVVVRYVAAAEVAQVGGDWYDAFLQADGSTVLVIGDVMGHDTRAAAAMGQLRALLRGIGYTTGTGPAEMLSRLDAAIEGLGVQTTATGLVVRLAPAIESADDLALTWSNAGHPPPIVHRPGRGAEVLDHLEPDLLLGVLAHTERQEGHTRLQRGGTMLLCTDGLIERRGIGIDEGIAALTAAVDRHGELPLPAMCDAILADLLPEDHDDDVALVAMRLQPLEAAGGVPQ